MNSSSWRPRGAAAQPFVDYDGATIMSSCVLGNESPEEKRFRDYKEYGFQTQPTYTHQTFVPFRNPFAAPQPDISTMVKTVFELTRIMKERGSASQFMDKDVMLLLKSSIHELSLLLVQKSGAGEQEQQPGVLFKSTEGKVSDKLFELSRDLHETQQKYESLRAQVQDLQNLPARLGNVLTLV